MIIWAIGTLIFSLLVCVAAIGASSSVSSTRRQTRAIWTAAIAACVLWPVIMPLLAAARDLAPRATVTPDVTPGTARRLAAQLPPLPAFVEARIELTLVSAWVMASLVLLSRLVRSQRALTRLCTASREQLLDGQRVLVNEHFGPATIGALRPRVTVPAWIVDLDPTLRRVILRHEQQHCSARDTALLWLAELATAVMPWNPALWWQSWRLRLAIEMDCDLRTLERSPDRETYARLLVLIAQRQSSHTRARILATFDSHLHLRIVAMQRPAVSISSARVLLPGALAVAAAIASCSPALRNDVSGVSASSLANNQIYNADQVATAAATLPGGKAPEYPAELRTAGVEGELFAQFVVDTAGLVETGSFKVSKSTDQRFTDAVQSALPGFRFSPARLTDGRKVRQLVVSPFAFALRR